MASTELKTPRQSAHAQAPRDWTVRLTALLAVYWIQFALSDRGEEPARALKTESRLVQSALKKPSCCIPVLDVHTNVNRRRYIVTKLLRTRKRLDALNPRRQSRSYRPRLESLEERCVPSTTNYVQTNLVSDIAGVAEFTDPKLVNPWGLTYSPTSRALLGLRQQFRLHYGLQWRRHHRLSARDDPTPRRQQTGDAWNADGRRL